MEKICKALVKKRKKHDKRNITEKPNKKQNITSANTLVRAAIRKTEKDFKDKKLKGGLWVFPNKSNLKNDISDSAVSDLLIRQECVELLTSWEWLKIAIAFLKEDSPPYRENDLKEAAIHMYSKILKFLKKVGNDGSVNIQKRTSNRKLESRKRERTKVFSDIKRNLIEEVNFCKQAKELNQKRSS